MHDRNRKYMYVLTSILLYQVYVRIKLPITTNYLIDMDDMVGESIDQSLGNRD